jgi:anthraniloyl-CoA monooxygenase
VQRYGAGPLDTPLTACGATFPGRLLVDVPAAAVRVEAPADEAGLPAARARVREVIDGGAELVAVHGGAAFTRTLVCEEIRLVHGRTAILVDGEADALTVVLSGRADAVVGADSEVRGGP